MRIPSGVTDQYVYFVAVDVTDFTTRETGLSTFTVYRSRNGGAAAAMTTPTINETDVTNMPGVYELLLDEDTTLDAGDDAQEMCFHITHAGMAPVTRTIEIYRPETTAGETLTVSSGTGNADMVAVSGDGTAADNIESTYDGTGYTDDAAPATQLQVGNLTSGSAAISTVAGSFVAAGAEPETNTYTATHEEDGTYHIVEDDATSTDCYYQFDVGGNGVPVAVTWIGYAQSNGDSYTIHAYNWGGASWDQIGSIAAANGTTPVTNTYSLTASHVGTGANDGLVRWRFLSADGTAFATDRLLCSYAVVSQSVGYALGSIWVDTNASNTSTETFVDGVADNPVSTWAAALTISGNLGINRFHLSAGSSITLTGNSDAYVINAIGSTVALGGQSVSGAEIIGATITGDDDGSNATATAYSFCLMGNSTLGLHRLQSCGLGGTVVIAEAGTYDWVNCHSRVAGTGTPVVNVGAAVANTNLNMRKYSGGIEVANMGQAGTDNMSLEGDGQLVLAASCTGGTIAIRGHYTVTDNAGGAVTLSDNARYDTEQNGLNHLLAASVTGTDITDDSIIASLVSSSATADWDDFVNTTDSLQAIRDRGDAAWATGAGTGLTPLASGTAQGGGAGTIQLAAGETFADDELNGNVVKITSGTGAGQSRSITDYTGATDTATVIPSWTTTPDATSVYEVVDGPSIKFGFSSATHGGRYAKQSTAVSITVGPLINVNTGAPISSLTVGDITAGIIKGTTNTNLTLTAAAGVNDFTHIANGYWALELTSSNVDTAGTLRVYLRDDDVFVPFSTDLMVVPDHVYDGLVAGTDNVQVDMTQVLGTAVNGGATAGYVPSDLLLINNDSDDATDLGAAIDNTNNVVQSNVQYISDDATAPQNLELAYDGTGYFGGTVKQSVSVGEVEGNSVAATALNRFLSSMGPDINTPNFTVSDASFSPTTTQFEVLAGSSTDDIYNGRFIVWPAGSGTNAGGAYEVTDYDGTNLRFTVANMPGAPGNNDFCVLI